MPQTQYLGQQHPDDMDSTLLFHPVYEFELPNANTLQKRNSKKVKTKSLVSGKKN